MRRLNTLEGLSDAEQPLVLTIGVFDGVHRGHQALVRKAREEAAAVQGDAWALTFDPHPPRVLAPARAPRLLTSSEHRAQLLAAQGLDGTVVLTFDAALARLEPEAFIDRLLAAAPRLHAVVVGSNWRFGHHARGDSALLRTLAARHGFQAHILDAVDVDGAPVSSTRVREAVESGALDRAAAMLGRRFGVLGEVIPGHQVGRKMNFPTANLRPESEILPPSGIYAAYGILDGERLPGAAYLASAGSERAGTVEIHLLDFDRDIYGHTLEIVFVRHLREDRAFPDAEALRAQIGRDVEEARTILEADAARQDEA